MKYRGRPVPNIKCRFCDFNTRRIYRNGSGKVTEGMDRIKSHIETEHPDEFEKIYGIEEDE